MSGQTIAQIAARKEFLAAAVECDMIVIDGGTNDIDALTATEIQDAREAIAEYYLGLGIPVVLLPILARSTAQWPGGDVKRQKAAWINQRSRDFCKGREACWLYDWNQPWADLTGSYVVPKAGYSNDGLHKAPPGGVAVGEDFANFLADILPPAQPRV
ncbi:SGNH/GDSL hydrolase family protein, partial [Azotobacter salinestris]